MIKTFYIFANAFGMRFAVIKYDSKNLFKVKEIGYNKKMRKKYPSDITKEQFEQLRSILESGRKKTVPRKVDLSEVILRHTVSVEKRLPMAYVA